MKIKIQYITNKTSKPAKKNHRITKPQCAAV